MDSGISPRDKQELLSRVRAERERLEARIGGMSAARLTEPGPDGWTVTDHLAHLATWQRKLLAMMRGRPGWEGLGVDARTYDESDIDALNEIVYQRNRARQPAEVLADFRRTHDEVLAAIEAMSDDDLLRPYNPTDPDETRRMLDGIADNTCNHDAEHAEYVVQSAQ